MGGRVVVTVRLVFVLPTLGVVLGFPAAAAVAGDGRPINQAVLRRDPPLRKLEEILHGATSPEFDPVSDDGLAVRVVPAHCRKRLDVVISAEAPLNAAAINRSHREVRPQSLRDRGEFAPNRAEVDAVAAPISLVRHEDAATRIEERAEGVRGQPRGGRESGGVERHRGALSRDCFVILLGGRIIRGDGRRRRRGEGGGGVGGFSPDAAPRGSAGQPRPELVAPKDSIKEGENEGQKGEERDGGRQ